MKNKLMSLVFLSLLLIGCNGNQQSRRSDAIDIGDKYGYLSHDFTLLTDLNEVKEIHSDEQKAYLSYQGEYYSIDPSLYPDGSKHLSDPLPVNISWNFVNNNKKKIQNYAIYWGKQEDLSDGYLIKGTLNNNIDIYNSYLGDNYFRIIAEYSDGSIDCSSIYKYQVNEKGPRNIKIDGMTNCRDMGGRVLLNGDRIKQGLIYRTSGTYNWGNGNAAIKDKVSALGKETLLGQLKIKSEINIDSNGANRIDVANYEHYPMAVTSGKHHLYRNIEPLKKVFHSLSIKENYPLFYHCRIGTDRTGLCAIMLYGLLGLNENEIYQDYLFSNFGNIQSKRYIGQEAGDDDISIYINDIKNMPGITFQNKVYNFLLSVGVPANELNNIINILTIGSKQNDNDNNQIIINADEFISEVANKSTSTTLSDPTIFYTLGNDQSVKANFTINQEKEVAVIAYLGSQIDDDSKINESIKVTIDEQELIISDISFKEAGFGKGANRTYYAPVILTNTSINAGNHQITVKGKNNNLNIAVISII